MAQTASNSTASTVRAELARRGVKGREIATALRIPERTFRRRLAGHVPFTVDELTAVARHIGVPVADLLPDEDDAPAAVSSS